MAKTPEEKKIAQAIAHKKWRESDKGKAYLLKKKIERSGVQSESKPEPSK